MLKRLQALKPRLRIIIGAILSCAVIAAVYVGVAQSSKRNDAETAEMMIARLCMLTPEQLENMNTDQLVELMMPIWGRNPSGFEVDAGLQYNWRSSSSYGADDPVSRALIYNDSVINLSHHNMHPDDKLRNILQVLGEPDQISALYEVHPAVTISIGLEYPEHGITVSVDKSIPGIFITSEGAEFYLRNHWPVSSVTCYTPGENAETVIKRDFEQSPDTVEWLLSLLMPWPGMNKKGVIPNPYYQPGE